MAIGRSGGRLEAAEVDLPGQHIDIALGALLERPGHALSSSGIV